MRLVPLRGDVRNVSGSAISPKAPDSPPSDFWCISEASDSIPDCWRVMRGSAPKAGLVFWQKRAEGAAHILGNPRRRRGSYFHFLKILVLLGSRSALILFVKAGKKKVWLHPAGVWIPEYHYYGFGRMDATGACYSDWSQSDYSGRYLEIPYVRGRLEVGIFKMKTSDQAGHNFHDSSCVFYGMSHLGT